MYIKCKFLKSDKPHGRAYVYRTDDNVKPGDFVSPARGGKLIVADEPVDMAWVEAYGADNVGVVKRYEESEVN